MGYLRIKNETADHVILVDEGCLVLAKVMENLHYGLRLQDLFKPVVKGVFQSQKVEHVAFS